MTRHELLIIRQHMNRLQKTIMDAPDFDGLGLVSIFWLGKVIGTVSGAITQIDADLEAGTPPRL